MKYLAAAVLVCFAVNPKWLYAQATMPPAPEINSDPTIHDPLAKYAATPSDVTAPGVIHKEEPRYTQSAYKRGIQGTVLLGLIVEPNGTPNQITVIRSLDPGLDAQAVYALEYWRFTPGKRHAQPVATRAQIEFTFHLNSSHQAPTANSSQASAAPPLTNAGIESLSLSGIRENEILRIIATAPRVNFDMTPGATQELISQHVSQNVIKAMSARVINGASLANSSGSLSPTRGPVQRPTLAQLARQKRQAVVVSLDGFRRDVPHSYTLNIPGYSRSECYGTGTWDYATVNCSGFTLEPTQIPIEVSRAEVREHVALDGMIYTLICTGRSSGSGCVQLPNGVQWPVDIDGTVMKVHYVVGGNLGKRKTAKFKILDIR